MQNIHIDGLGKFFGGEYGTVHIDGTASCTGNLVCESISAAGAFHCTGSLSSKQATVDGSMNIGGPMESETLSVDGALSVEGDLRTVKLQVDGALSVTADLYAVETDVDGSLSVQNKLQTKKLAVDGALAANAVESENIDVDGSLQCTDLRGGAFHCNGSANITGSFYAGEVTVDGTLTAAENLEAKSIRADGCITVAGQISADKIEICGRVKANEIVGDHIQIEFDPRPHRLIKKLLGGELQEEPFCANLIEATTIQLIGVAAGVVSGENVTIGENCRIDRLDCIGAYTIDPTSTVRILTGEPYAN